MKQLTTILLLTILALGCNAQEPTTHVSYSVGYVEAMQYRLDSIQAELDYSKSENVILNDSINILQHYIVSDSVIVMADSIYFKIIGSGVTIEIGKEGQHASFKTRPNNIVIE